MTETTVTVEQPNSEQQNSSSPESVVAVAVAAGAAQNAAENAEEKVDELEEQIEEQDEEIEGFRSWMTQTDQAIAGLATGQAALLVQIQAMNGKLSEAIANRLIQEQPVAEAVVVETENQNDAEENPDQKTQSKKHRLI